PEDAILGSDSDLILANHVPRMCLLSATSEHSLYLYLKGATIHAVTTHPATSVSEPVRGVIVGLAGCSLDRAIFPKAHVEVEQTALLLVHAIKTWGTRGRPPAWLGCCVILR